MTDERVPLPGPMNAARLWKLLQRKAQRWLESHAPGLEAKEQHQEGQIDGPTYEPIEQREWWASSGRDSNPRVSVSLTETWTNRQWTHSGIVLTFGALLFRLVTAVGAHEAVDHLILTADSPEARGLFEAYWSGRGRTN